MVTDEEYWKPIKNFPNHVVSSHGRVKNSDRNRLVKPYLNDKDELCVNFSYGNVEYQGTVAWLMAENFFGAKWGRVKIEFRDGNPANPDMFNILLSDQDGIPLIYRLNFNGNWYRVRGRQGREIEIVETGQRFHSGYDAARAIHGVPQSVYRCLRGEAKRHRGFTFRYVGDKI